MTPSSTSRAERAPTSGEPVATPVATLPKPLLRGWFHAVAALAALTFTVAACLRVRGDPARLVSVLVFGLSMIELFGVSALYHIGHWRGPVARKLRALDHANIFVFIAGTYTPLCFNILAGWFRPTLLSVIWVLAALGIGLATATARTPRWLHAALYVAMGWVALLALPAFLAVRPPLFVVVLLLGGALYTVGAVIYATKRPNPWPAVFGFHEIFHLFVVGGAVAFATAVWIWALPVPRA
jgi:hemolysin III